MRIEEISKDTIKKASDYILDNLWFRSNQIFTRYFKDHEEVTVAKNINRDDLTRKYAILKAEMNRRAFKKRKTPLDSEISAMVLKRAIWGMDPGGMKEIVLSKNFISISGDFIKAPKQCVTVDAFISLHPDDKNDFLESELVQVFKDELGKDVSMNYQPSGPRSTFLPIYDLVLRPRPELRKDEPVNVKMRKELSPKDLVCCYCERPASWIYVFKDEDGAECLEATCNHHRTPTRSNIEKAQGLKVERVIAVSKWEEERNKPVERKPAPEFKKKETSMVPLDQLTHRESKDDIFINKPYTNEHACRMKSPGSYDEFRSQEKEIGGKKVRFIYGIRTVDGKRVAELQSIRYPTKEWTETDAKDDCYSRQPMMFEEAKRSLAKAVEFKILKINEPEFIVGGIVYEPDVVDAHGDYTDAEEIWKALKQYMIQGGKVKVMHEGRDLGRAPIVESYYAEDDHLKGSVEIKKGSWFMSIYLGDHKDVWKRVTDGELTGFSMGGTGSATAATATDLERIAE